MTGILDVAQVDAPRPPGVGGPAAATDRSVQPGPVLLAGFRLDRVGGIGTDALDVSAGTRVRLADLAAAEARLDVLAGPLTDALFAAVPQCDRDRRRVLLAAKRSVHRGLALDATAVETLDAAGVDPDRTRAWTTGIEQVAGARTRLAATVAEETAALGARLRATVGDSDLTSTLALLAPELLRHIDTADLTPGSRAARTALLYVIRSAVKPSPLGRLTAVALHPDGPVGRRSAALPVGLARSVFDGLAVAGGDFRDLAPYAVGDRVLIGRISDTDGFLWWNQQLMDPSGYRDDLDDVRLGRSVSAARRSRQIRTGLRVPELPWPRGVRDPLGALSARTGEQHIAAAIEQTRRAADRVAATDGRDRLVPAAALADRIAELTDRCGAPPWSGALLYEDTTATVAAPDLPATVDEDLRTVAASIRPHLFRSHLYDLVLDAFRRLVGPGGVAPDAAAFFCAAYADPRVRAGIHAAQRADLTCDPTAGGRNAMPVGRTSAPPAAGLLYQLAADDAMAVHQGRYRLVLNQIVNAQGGLLTRFRGLLGDDVVEEHLSRWHRAQFPDVEVRTLTLSAGVNNLQHAGAASTGSVTWPGEAQVATPGDVGVQELCLVHDRASDTLEFRHHGRPLACLYTGMVPATLCPGPVRLALAVMDPWIDGSPLTRHNHPVLRAAAAAHAPDEVRHEPRRVCGRVVENRARWLVPTDAVPRPARHEEDADYLRRLDAWRRRIGLPHEVFLVGLGSDPLDADHRKPMWWDLASPHSCHVVLPLLAGTSHVRLEEALPARDQAWLQVQGSARGVEHASFVSFDRPSTGGS